METLGQKIRKLRKERRMTQQALADGLVTASMISQIEADRTTPSPKLLESLAGRLGISPEVFLEDVSAKSDQMQTYRKARTLMELEQYSQAAELLESLVDPVGPQFRAQSLCNDLADCYEQLRQYDDANRMLEKVVAISFTKDDVQSAVHAYYRLGRLERRRNRLPMARSYFRRASAVLDRHANLNMPLAPKIYTALGRICLALRDYAESLHNYNLALEYAQRNRNDSETAVIYHGIASVMKDQGNDAQALTATQKAIQCYERLSQSRAAMECRVNLAVIYRRLARYEDALDELSVLIQAVDIRRDLTLWSSCCLERVLTLHALGRKLEAMECAVASLEESLLREHQIELLEFMVSMTLDQGMVEKATEYLRQAIQVAEPMQWKRLVALYAEQISLLTLQGELAQAGSSALALSRAVNKALGNNRAPRPRSSVTV